MNRRRKSGRSYCYISQGAMGIGFQTVLVIYGIMIFAMLRPNVVAAFEEKRKTQ